MPRHLTTDDALEGGGAALSDDTPLASGTADAGVSTEASRSDHVHPDSGGGGGTGSSEATVVQTDTATGSGPHTVDTTGVAEGDLCLWVMSTRNAVPDVNGPEGGGWTNLWHVDLSSDEEVAVWFKVAGAAEPATWDWAVTGSTNGSGLVIYRGIDTLVHYGRSDGRTCPAVLGASDGAHLVIGQSCYQATSIGLTDPMGLLTVDLSFQNGDQGVIVGRRDALFPAAQPQFSFTGGAESPYASCGAVVFE